MAYLDILRDVLPDNAIVTDELLAGRLHLVVRLSRLPAAHLHHLRLSGHARLRLSTALGAKVAQPDRPVVAITGDGGFMFAVQELATAVQFKIGVVTLVFNNNAWRQRAAATSCRCSTAAWWRRIWSIRISSSSRNPSASVLSG